ncbi:hypothetical protein TURU_157950 [Turdus rufiventris]|nr:hypothetical protein TURU_157950 [Turdus rufiventris]
MVLEASGTELSEEEGHSALCPRAQHSEISISAGTPGAELPQPAAKPHPEPQEHQQLSGEPRAPQTPEHSREAGAVLHPPGSSLSPERCCGDQQVTPFTQITVEVDVHVSAGDHGEPDQGQAAAKSELLRGTEQEPGAGDAWGTEEKAGDGQGSGDGWGAEQEAGDGWGKEEGAGEFWGSGDGWGAEQEAGDGWGKEEGAGEFWGSEDGWDAEKGSGDGWGAEEGAGDGWGSGDGWDADQEAEDACVGKAFWEVPVQKAGDTTAASCPLEEPELPLKAAEPGESITNGQGAAPEHWGEETEATSDLQLGQTAAPEGVEGTAGGPEQAEPCDDEQTSEESPACLPETQEEKTKVSSEGKAEEH